MHADDHIMVERRRIGLSRRLPRFREKLQARNMQEAAGFVPGMRMNPRRNDLHQRQKNQKGRARELSGHELIR